MSDLLLGIDVGTSSVKCLLCTFQGQVLAQASAEHNLHSPEPGWAEEDPADWISNAIAVIRACLEHPGVNAERIASVGVSGMVPAIILLDDQGKVLRPAILQNDARSFREIVELEREVGIERFFEQTGARLSQQSVGPRLMWLQRHEPETWSKVSKVMGSYDYINFHLTGVQSTERNWALESGFYNLEERNWSDKLLYLCHVKEPLLPPVHDPATIIGGITKDFSEVSGLFPGTPVVAGSADHVAAALAAGINQEGDLLLKYGSSGDILYCSDRLILDPRLFIDYHDLPGKFLLNGCMSTSGSLLKWYANAFCQEDLHCAQGAGEGIYAYLDKKASTIPAGCEGLVVLPYFLGEKTPIFDASARGVFFGLTLAHNRYHLYRAIMEAVAFGFRHHIEVLQEMGLRIRRVVASEGGAKSSLWRQITADVIGQPVDYLVNNPGAAYGAALVAGMALGSFQDGSNIEQQFIIGNHISPGEENSSVYKHSYEVYRSLYLQLRGLFTRI